jgi:hypothetical protein
VSDTVYPPVRTFVCSVCGRREDVRVHLGFKPLPAGWWLRELGEVEGERYELACSRACVEAGWMGAKSP